MSGYNHPGAAARARMLTVRCDHCGKTNRIPVAAEGTPRCGNCHRPLPWIVDADEQDFTEVAERATLPVLVDLWAAWCGPCRMVSPALERVAREMAGRIKLVKVDVDKSQRLQQRFTVMAVPTLLILDRGREIARQAGAAPPHVLREWAEKAIARRAQPA